MERRVDCRAGIVHYVGIFRAAAAPEKPPPTRPDDTCAVRANLPLFRLSGVDRRRLDTHKCRDPVYSVSVIAGGTT